MAKESKREARDPAGERRIFIRQAAFLKWLETDCKPRQFWALVDAFTRRLEEEEEREVNEILGIRK